MSRHRNVRSMNYSEECDGFDDVYGHSVEDDYSISPSVAGFMYDRSRPPESAFLREENDIAEEDEDMLEEEPIPGTTDLSEMDQARLISCIEEIQNIIGDAVPANVVREKVIKSGFDFKKALDAILNENEGKKATVQPAGEVKFAAAISTAKDIEKGRDVAEKQKEAKFSIESLRSQNKSAPNSQPASSLAELSQNYLKNAGGGFQIPKFGSPGEKSVLIFPKFGPKSRGEEIPSLQGTNLVIPKLKKDSEAKSSPRSFIIPKLGSQSSQDQNLIIPKLKSNPESPSSSGNFVIPKFKTNSQEQKISLVPKSKIEGGDTPKFLVPKLKSASPSSSFAIHKLEASQSTETEPSLQFCKLQLNSTFTPNEENVMIDLSSALKNTSIKSEPRKSPLRPFLYGMVTETSVEKSIMALRQKRPSPLGRVISRERSKRPKREPAQTPAQNRITPFDFATPSPDDKILFYLGRS